MPWFRVDDQFHGHPKTRRVSLAALGLWTVAGSYCNAYKTDGYVDVPFVTSWPRGRALAAELVRGGLWREDDVEGWWFHDWLDVNPSAAEIEAERAAARERQRKSRENRRNRLTGQLEKAPAEARDASVCHAPVTRDRRVSHTTHTRPDQTRPLSTYVTLRTHEVLTSSQIQRTSGYGPGIGLGEAA